MLDCMKRPTYYSKGEEQEGKDTRIGWANLQDYMHLLLHTVEHSNQSGQQRAAQA